MPNYELTKDGMTTSDAVIAAMFFDIDPSDNAGLAVISYEGDGVVGRCVFGTTNVDGELYETDEFIIPYTAIKSAIAPVDGEAFVEIGFKAPDTDGLILYGANDTMTKPDVDKRLNWRVIILCQDHGELRELQADIERWG